MSAAWQSRSRLEDDTLVLADETRLAQVFANLMQNSVRYTDAPGRIAIAVKRDGDKAVVEWHDSAPGVAAAGPAALDRAPVPGRGLAQPGQRRLRARAGHRARHRRGPRRHPHREREPAGRAVDQVGVPAVDRDDSWLSAS